jgi:hypothetical protein
MDGSPSFAATMSCEPSPSSNSTSQAQLTSKKTISPNSLNKVVTPSVSNPPVLKAATSSLDEFFEFLNVEKLGLADHAATSSSAEQIIKLDPFKTNPIKNETSFGGSNNELRSLVAKDQHQATTSDNLYETAADLERSLNKLYALKENSSVATSIDDLQKLEQQMQESMQYILMLKNKQQEQQKQLVVMQQNQQQVSWVIFKFLIQKSK